MPSKVTSGEISRQRVANSRSRDSLRERAFSSHHSHAGNVYMYL